MEPITERAHGIDTYVDEYKRDGQDKLIVPKLATLPGQIDFVIAQIYQGGFWKDFPIVWENLCSPCGIRLEYVYQVSWESWLKQAEETLAHTPSDCQGMILDIEKIGNTVDKTMLADSSRILRYWKQERPDLKILYYSNIDVYINYILPIMAKNYQQDKWFLEFDLWVSQWPLLKTLRSPNNNPSLPKNMRGDWKLFQYTDAGDKSLYSAADLDVFNGPVSDMRAWLGLDAQTPPSEPPAEEPPAEPPASVPSIVTGTVTAPVGLNVHAEADLSSPVIGGLVANSRVPVEVQGYVAELHGFVATQYLAFMAEGEEPKPAPDPVPMPAPQPQADVSPIKYGVLKTQIIENGLTTNDKYTPAVVQIQDQPKPDGKKGAPILILPNAAAYIRKINDEKGAHYALETVGAMWINTPPNGGTPKGESISCQHNIVSWEIEKNGCAKLRCFMNDEAFDFDPKAVNWFTRPDLFFKAVALNLEGHFIKVANAVDCYIPLMARHSNNGTGELWLALNEIEPFPALPVTVTIRPDDSNGKLNIRQQPGTGAEDIGDYVSGETVTVLQYRPLGASVWGRTDEGWICLLQADRPGQRQFWTSWKLDTAGVIPPG